jgi:hypothetical protein
MAVFPSDDYQDAAVQKKLWNLRLWKKVCCDDMPYHRR